MSARIFILATALILSAVDPAAARSPFDLSGVAIAHIGAIESERAPDQFGGRPDGVGFKYSFHGWLWVDFWRNEGQFVVYKGDQYLPVSKKDAAALLNMDESELEAPFFYHVSPGMFGSIVLLLVGTFIFAAIRINRREAPDPGAQAYDIALEVFRETVRKNREIRAKAGSLSELPEEADPWEAALAVLVASGVDKADAEDNLSRLLAEAIAAPPKAA